MKRPVKVADLLPYAKKGCKTCFGKGLFNVVAPGGDRVQRYCNCALARFLRARAADIERDEVTNQLFIEDSVADMGSVDGDGRQEGAATEETKQ